MTRSPCWNAPLPPTCPALPPAPPPCASRSMPTAWPPGSSPRSPRPTGFLFDLVIDDQDVSQDWLRRGEVVAAITSHPGPLQGCDTMPLAPALPRHRLARLSARWFPRRRRPPRRWPRPRPDLFRQGPPADRWVARRIGGPTRPLLPTPPHRLVAGLCRCLPAGPWLGHEPRTAGRAPLATGSLVELVPDTPLDVPLYWQFTRLAAPALAPVTEAIRRAARASLVS